MSTKRKSRFAQDQRALTSVLSSALAIMVVVGVVMVVGYFAIDAVMVEDDPEIQQVKLHISEDGVTVTPMVADRLPGEDSELTLTRLGEDTTEIELHGVSRAAMSGSVDDSHMTVQQQVSASGSRSFGYLSNGGTMRSNYAGQTVGVSADDVVNGVESEIGAGASNPEEADWEAGQPLHINTDSGVIQDGDVLNIQLVDHENNNLLLDHDVRAEDLPKTVIVSPDPDGDIDDGEIPNDASSGTNARVDRGQSGGSVNLGDHWDTGPGESGPGINNPVVARPGTGTGGGGTGGGAGTGGGGGTGGGSDSGGGTGSGGTGGAGTGGGVTGPSIGSGSTTSGSSGSGGAYVSGSGTADNNARIVQEGGELYVSGALMADEYVVETPSGEDLTISGSDYRDAQNADGRAPLSAFQADMASAGVTMGDAEQAVENQAGTCGTSGGNDCATSFDTASHDEQAQQTAQDHIYDNSGSSSSSDFTGVSDSSGSSSDSSSSSGSLGGGLGSIGSSAGGVVGTVSGGLFSGDSSSSSSSSSSGGFFGGGGLFDSGDSSGGSSGMVSGSSSGFGF